MHRLSNSFVLLAPPLFAAERIGPVSGMWQLLLVQIAYRADGCRSLTKVVSPDRTRRIIAWMEYFAKSVVRF
jgi:hypothetical protein